MPGAIATGRVLIRRWGGSFLRGGGTESGERVTGSEEDRRVAANAEPARPIKLSFPLAERMEHHELPGYLKITRWLKAFVTGYQEPEDGAGDVF